MRQLFAGGDRHHQKRLLRGGLLQGALENASAATDACARVRAAPRCLFASRVRFALEPAKHCSLVVKPQMRAPGAWP